MREHVLYSTDTMTVVHALEAHNSWACRSHRQTDMCTSGSWSFVIQEPILRGFTVEAEPKWVPQNRLAIYIFYTWVVVQLNQLTMHLRRS